MNPRHMILLLTLSICGNAFANIFATQSLLELNLEYDISKLQAEKENLREDGLPGKLTTLSDNKHYEVEILARGAGSFDCQQPQLSFKFKSKQNNGTIFEGLKKVKVFTKGTCLENRQDEDQDKQIIANYLIYKLYEEMADKNFQTRLLRINYTDISGKIAPYSQYAFFLEPVQVLEKRLGLVNLEEPEMQILNTGIVPLMNKDLLSTVNGFEFFIANLDYGVPGFFSHILQGAGSETIYYLEKNAKLFQSPSGEIFPIIYDFDISRFAYFGPICLFGYRFFMSDEFDPTCSVEAIKTSIQEDLNQFRYASDVASNKPKLIQGFHRWKVKHADLISTLGKTYEDGMLVFIHSFDEAIP